MELNKKTAQFIKSNADMIASEIMKSQFEIQKELKTRYNEAQVNYCLQDIKYHMSYLAESISYSKPELFYHYLKWVKTLFASMNIPEEDLALNLSVSADALFRIMPDDIKNIPSPGDR